MSGLTSIDATVTTSDTPDAVKSWRGLVKGQRTILFVLAALIPALVVLLMGTIVWISLTADGADSFGKPGLQNFSRAFLDDSTVTAIGNTLRFTLVTLVVAFAFGTSIAWLTERTDIGGKRVIYGTMLLGLVIPTFFLAMGWILFAHPRIGLLNHLAQMFWGPDTVVFNVSSIGGMGFVEGLALAPHVFVMTSGALRLMNPVLEEAGAIHGLGSAQILRRITIPLLLPALAAAAIYIAVIAVSSFDVPAVIGLAARIYTFSTMIYVTALSPDRAPQYGIPAAVGVIMSLIGLVLTLWYIRLLRSAEKFQVVSGKAYFPSLVSLRRGRWIGWMLISTFVVLSFVIPLLLVIWASLQPFLSVPSVAALSRVSLSQFRGVDWSLMARGGLNTAILFFVVPTVALALSIPIAWVITRSRSRLRYVYEVLVFLPHAVPKVIFGVAALLLALYGIDKVIPVYGTVWLIALVYVVERITFTTRVVNSTMLQIHPELEEAAYVNGLELFSTLRRVIVPILWPTLVSTWIWTALICYRELTVAAILFTPNSITLPVVIWSMWAGGGMGRAAAATLVMLAFFVPLLGLYWLINRQRGGARDVLASPR